MVGVVLPVLQSRTFPQPGTHPTASGGTSEVNNKRKKMDSDGFSYPVDQDSMPVQCQKCEAREMPLLIDGEWCCVECEWPLEERRGL
jgi:hypothetical protein